MIDVVAGIDIGGTFTQIGIVDPRGRCSETTTIHTAAFRNIDRFLEQLDREIRNLMNMRGKTVSLRGVGLGAPNANGLRGTIEYAPNLPWKGVVPLVKKFRKFFGDRPVVLANDADVAALGEMAYGGAKKMKNFVLLTLGTGLGSSFVVNGHLVCGHDGHAGELGHVNVKHNGRVCRCGNRGCLETYVSATGIKRTFLSLLAARPLKSDLRKVSAKEITSEMIYHAAGDGDMLACEAFATTGAILGRALANVVAITGPEAIFLLGGLSRAGELIFKPARESMEKNLFPVFRKKVKILPSALKGQNAAVLGAGTLAWKDLNSL